MEYLDIRNSISQHKFTRALFLASEMIRNIGLRIVGCHRSYLPTFVRNQAEGGAGGQVQQGLNLGPEIVISVVSR